MAKVTKSVLFATLSDFGIYQQNTYFENNHIFLGENISNLFVFVLELCRNMQSFVSLTKQQEPGLEVIKLFSCSTQLSKNISTAHRK